ncbi:hypothetical protein TWF718_006703 [Orbilia javanica]|uniref:Uncharacterized protein n=1 Tax=Orbilia javanica TaxID=47235 RepID=A0AAN8N5R4_9PEZI
MSNYDTPTFTSVGDKTSYPLQHHKIHFPLSSNFQPNVLVHPNLKISIFTRSFVENYILNKPLPWVASQTIRLTTNSLISDASQHGNQYTILPVVIHSTPYFLPVLVVENIDWALTQMQHISVIIDTYPDSKNVDGVISSAAIGGIWGPESPLNPLSVMKPPNFNWVEGPDRGEERELGIVLEVYAGNMNGKGMVGVYCGPGSVYNDAWKTGVAKGRNLVQIALEGVKRATIIIEKAKKNHGYPVSFAYVGVNCAEVAEKLEGWDKENAVQRPKKRGAWREVLKILDELKKSRVGIGFHKLRRQREDMIEGITKRRLWRTFPDQFNARSQREEAVDIDSIELALYPHCLENGPLATSSDRFIMKNDVLELLQLESFGAVPDKKEPELRRSSRNRKRLRKNEEGKFSSPCVGLEATPRDISKSPHLKATLSKSPLFNKGPVVFSGRPAHMDENIKGGSDIDDDERSLGFKADNYKRSGDTDHRGCAFRKMKDLSESKAPGTPLSSNAPSLNANSLLFNRQAFDIGYEDVAVDLLDSQEWKRILGVHLATREPLWYPWAPVIDYLGAREKEGAAKEEGGPIRSVGSPWTQFGNDLGVLRAPREGFGYEVSTENDEDAIYMSADGSSEDEATWFRAPGLDRSRGPSPESLDEARTPLAYLEKHRKEPVEFDEGQRELDIPELEFENAKAYQLELPADVEPQERGSFIRELSLRNSTESQESGDEEWTLEELQTIDEIMGEIYGTPADQLDCDNESGGYAEDLEYEDDMAGSPQEDSYPRTRGRSRSLSRLRRRIGDVKLGDELTCNGDTAQEQHKVNLGSPDKKVFPRSSTRVSRSPVKGRAPRSQAKGFANTSRIEKPGGQNMTFKGLAKAMTQMYELIGEGGAENSTCED